MESDNSLGQAIIDSDGKDGTWSLKERTEMDNDELMSLGEIDACEYAYDQQPYPNIAIEDFKRLLDSARASHKLKQRVEELEEEIEGIYQDMAGASI